jgi:hypothetical protein
LNIFAAHGCPQQGDAARAKQATENNVFRVILCFPENEKGVAEQI